MRSSSTRRGEGRAGTGRRTAWALVVALACTPEFEAVDGELLTFEHSPELTPCAGNAAALDAIARRFAGLFDLPSAGQLRYTWLLGGPDDLWIPQSGCVSGGCGVGDHAFSASPFHVHELAHVVIGGDSRAYFAEGIATALAAHDDVFGGGDVDGRYIPALSGGLRPDPRESMDSLTSRGVDYAVAGSFVSFLIVRHGPAKFADFYDRLHSLDSMAVVREVFRRVYGRSLDDEADAFMQGAPCAADSFILTPPECGSPEVPWSGDRGSFGAVLACEEDEAVAGGYGTRDGAFDLARRTVTFTIPAGLYAIRFAGDPGTRARFGPCFGCPWDAVDVEYDEAAPSATSYLGPGRYYLTLYGDPLQAQRAGLSLEVVRDGDQG